MAFSEKFWHCYCRDCWPPVSLTRDLVVVPGVGLSVCARAPRMARCPWTPSSPPSDRSPTVTDDPNRIPSADDLRAAVLSDPGSYGLEPREASNFAGLDDERIERTLRDAASQDAVVSMASVRLDRELAAQAVRNRSAKQGRGQRDAMLYRGLAYS